MRESVIWPESVEGWFVLVASINWLILMIRQTCRMYWGTDSPWASIAPPNERTAEPDPEEEYAKIKALDHQRELDAWDAQLRKTA